MSKTHAGGGDANISQQPLPFQKLFFFHTPPFMPNYMKFPTRPPVLLIKVVPHPPLSPGLVMVSAKVMVRPPNFGGENPQKSQKDEKKSGDFFF
jgi:hypothetical protein